MMPADWPPRDPVAESAAWVRQIECRAWAQAEVDAAFEARMRDPMQIVVVVS